MSIRGVRALVTDAHSTAALAVVRSLGAAGVTVTVVGERGRLNLAAHSRYSRHVLRCAHAESHPALYARQMVDELERTRYDLLIPLTDTTVTIVQNLRERFDRLVTVALPPNQVLEAARDKQLTIEIAQKNGVSVPTTRTFGSMRQLEAAAPGLSYPCVVKPRFSGRWNGGSAITRGTVRFAASPDDLIALVRAAHATPDLCLVQDVVRGAGVGVFVVANDGEPLAIFVHQRIREANPTGGRASLARSIVADSRLVAPALRLLKALRWHGVAMVEFKDPGAPRPPVLMEVNGRFWGSLPLAIEAGVDFPVLLAGLLLNGPFQPAPAYTVGVQCRYLKADLSYLTAAIKGRPAHWTGPFPGAVEAFAAIASWPGRWRPYNFRFNDPVPALVETGDFIVSAMRSLAGRMTSANGHGGRDQA